MFLTSRWLLLAHRINTKKRKISRIHVGYEKFFAHFRDIQQWFTLILVPLANCEIFYSPVKWWIQITKDACTSKNYLKFRLYFSVTPDMSDEFVNFPFRPSCFGAFLLSLSNLSAISYRPLKKTRKLTRRERIITEILITLTRQTIVSSYEAEGRQYALLPRYAWSLRCHRYLRVAASGRVCGYFLGIPRCCLWICYHLPDGALLASTQAPDLNPKCFRWVWKSISPVPGKMYQMWINAFCNCH